jgi:hypothetical protein
MTGHQRTASKDNTEGKKPQPGNNLGGDWLA